MTSSVMRFLEKSRRMSPSSVFRFRLSEHRKTSAKK